MIAGLAAAILVGFDVVVSLLSPVAELVGFSVVPWDHWGWAPRGLDPVVRHTQVIVLAAMAGQCLRRAWSDYRLTGLSQEGSPAVGKALFIASLASVFVYHPVSELYVGRGPPVSYLLLPASALWLCFCMGGGKPTTGRRGRLRTFLWRSTWAVPALFFLPTLVVLMISLIVSVCVMADNLSFNAIVCIVTLCAILILIHPSAGPPPMRRALFNLTPLVIALLVGQLKESP